MERKTYPGDRSDDEWAFVAPYLTLMTEDAPQRDYSLLEVFNGLRWIIRAGALWRMMPNDLRALLRLAKGRKEQPTAAIEENWLSG